MPTGYCTAGEACKIKGAGIPSGCVYCGSKIIGKRHKINWQIIKKEASQKLSTYATLTKKGQDEYELFAIHWRNNIAAADYVLDDTAQYKNNKGARA